MNMNRLKFLLILAAALVLSGCGGAGEKADAGHSSTAASTSNVNATAPAPAPDSAANATTANVSAVAPTPTTTGEATQPAASPKGSARGSSNVQQANMPKPQIGSGGNDFYLFTQARGALNADAELKTANITVDVKEGVMTLKGAVANAEQKSKAEQLARGVGGVKDVKNQLRVSGGN
jgi:hyperosmotically inducible protein